MASISKTSRTYNANQGRHPLVEGDRGIWRPLRDPLKQTRVLAIEKNTSWYAAWNLPIVARLEHVEIGQVASQHYTAVSYCWGEDKSTGSIIVDGCKVQISPNLESALRHLRADEDEELKVWCDALSVNQVDLDEKAAQVSIFGDIFRCANSVVAWLGGPSHDSGLAMNLLQRLGSLDRTLWQNLVDGYDELYTSDNAGLTKGWSPAFCIALWQAKRRLGQNVVKDLVKNKFTRYDDRKHERAWAVLAQLFSDPEIAALRTLFQREYWSRMWVWQEILLSSNVVFKCGRNSCAGIDLIKAVLPGFMQVELLSSTQDFAYSYCALHKDINTAGQLDKYKGGTISLLTLLIKFSNRHCLFPRDKIFAIRSVCRDDEWAQLNKPTYAGTETEVLMRLTETWISHFHNLDILNFCNTPKRYPTWTLNMVDGIAIRKSRIQNQYLGSTVSADTLKAGKNESTFSASKGLLCDEFHILNDSLTLKGFVVDEVQVFDMVGILGMHIERWRALAITWGKMCSFHSNAAICFWMTLAYAYRDDYPVEPAVELDLEATIKHFEATHGWENPDWNAAGKFYHFFNRQHAMSQAGWFFVTRQGRMGVSQHVELPLVGDRICILYGAQTPMILRPRIGGGYMLLGECYVHHDGIMHGRAVDACRDGVFHEQHFSIH